MSEELERLYHQISNHEDNRAYSKLGWQPLYQADERALVAVVGHAPGRRAQATGLPWNDASGDRLIQWMGIDEADFRNPAKIAHIPMDFYYPGKGASGDLPPRKGFAPLWHPQLIRLMPRTRLFLLVGAYAQGYYLGEGRKRNLTETVRAFEEYLPRYFPLVHPSPLNFRWQQNNPWFEEVVLPRLKDEVRSALEG